MLLMWWWISEQRKVCIVLKMEGLAAALVESGWREEDEDSNMLWHWSVLNVLSASFFTANLPSLSSMRKILLETFLHIREGELYFYSFPFAYAVLLLLCSLHC